MKVLGKRSEETMAKKITACAVFVLLAGFEGLLRAQTAANEPFKYPVSLDIRASDEALKNRIMSIVTGGLRALGDVAVVDEKPRFLIHIVGVGNTLSYGLAVEFTERYDLVATWHFFLERVLPSASQATSTEMGEAVSPLAFMAKAGEVHLVVTAFRGSEIDQTSRDVVASFDTNILIPERKANRALGDVLRDALPKK
jgi:hypothetical protein